MPSNQRPGKDIGELEEEVSRLRHLVFDLIPPTAAEVLRTYGSCEKREHVWPWLREIAGKLVEQADRRPAEEMGVYMGTGERAYCPLCGGGTLGPYPPKGYAWPEGLRRHLLGEYNSTQCGVMWTAKNAATDSSESELLRRIRKSP